MTKTVMTAVPTFWTDRRSIDAKAMEHHFYTLQKQGVTGCVLGGTTGEGLVLSHEERRQLVRLATPLHGTLWGGVCALDMHEVKLQADTWEKAGVQALLVLAPPYLHPDENSLWRYYEAVFRASHLPIVLYNNPKRTGVNLTINFVERLMRAYEGRLIGIKDSTSELTRPTLIRQLGLSLLAGDDAPYHVFLAQGADGIVSVSANVVMPLYKALHAAWGDENQWLEAVRVFSAFHFVFHRFPNPVGIKLACALLYGWPAVSMRFPLWPEADLTDLAKALRDVGLDVKGSGCAYEVL